MIVANLPYGRRDAHLGRPALRAGALTDGSRDGSIRAIVAGASDHLNARGWFLLSTATTRRRRWRRSSRRRDSATSSRSATSPGSHAPQAVRLHSSLERAPRHLQEGAAPITGDKA
jgi:hypothetical protein